MIRKMLLPLVAVAGLLAAPAVAGAQPAAQPAASDDVSAAACAYVTKQAMYLRARPTTNSTGLAWLAKGERFTSTCGITSGQRLGDCLPGSRTNNVWLQGLKDGHTGWVFSSCVRNA